MTDTDIPLTLAEAAALYHLTVSTLRTEAARHHLVIFRIGRRDYTTRADMVEMIRKCRDEDSRRGSTSTHSAEPGPCEMATASSALDALKASVQALKGPSPNTRPGNMSPSRHRPR
jgi:hypothetical protein